MEEVWFNQEWNLTLRRMLLDWEIGRLAELYSTLKQFKGTSNLEDHIAWQGNKEVKFTVKSIYREYDYANNDWSVAWNRSGR